MKTCYLIGFTDGEVTKKYIYDAFGVEKNIDENDTNAFRYCGEYYDTETGTIYLRARYYNPSTGRFISRDSFAGRKSDPLSLNLYTYCHNNPIRYIDPSGHGVISNAINNAKKAVQNKISSTQKAISNAANSIANYAKNALTNAKISNSNVDNKNRSGAPGCSLTSCIDGCGCAAHNSTLPSEYYYEYNNIKQIDHKESDKYMSQVKDFQNIYKENIDTYKKISSEKDIPSQLIAEIHFRESSCDFNAYFQNGDPLGKSTVNWPTGIYCETFSESAIMALTSEYFVDAKNNYSLTANSTDIVSMCAFAETYNGWGYRDKGYISPYVFSGTNIYTSGLYVKDGKFDKKAVDGRPGVYLLIDSIM